MNDITEGWDGYPDSAWDRSSLALIAYSQEFGGVVLWSAGPHVRFEQREVLCGNDLGELGLDSAPEGLSVWEGRYAYRDPGDETSVPEGSFRPLTEMEWASVRNSECPWDDADWRRSV